MARVPTTRRPLTGWHVFAWVAGFFGIIILSNIAFIYFAVSSHRGEDVPKSYRQGIAYNAVIDARSAQARLGWNADLGVTPRGELRLSVTDEGLPVRNLDLAGTLRHPVDRNRDVSLTLKESSPGTYTAPLPEVAGRWGVWLESTAADTPFRLASELKF